MDFVDRDRHIAAAGGAPPGHPALVVPFDLTEIGYHRGGARRTLGAQAIRIGLQREQLTMQAFDLEFVERVIPDIGYEEFPDSAFISKAHGETTAIPAAEIADDADAARIRCPYREGR